MKTRIFLLIIFCLLTMPPPVMGSGAFCARDERLSAVLSFSPEKDIIEIRVENIGENTLYLVDPEWATCEIVTTLDSISNSVVEQTVRLTWREPGPWFRHLDSVEVISLAPGKKLNLEYKSAYVQNTRWINVKYFRFAIWYVELADDFQKKTIFCPLVRFPSSPFDSLF